MAITNIQIAANGDGLSVSLPITDGSGNNRKVICLCTQDRVPPNITNPTYNGVTGALVGTVTNSNTTLRAMIYEWLDANLPSSGGTYTLAVTGPGNDIAISGFSCSGAKQSAAVTSQSDGDAGADADDPSFTFTADAGSIAFIALVDASAAQTITKGGGQTDILAPTSSGSAQHAHSYDSADLTVSYARTNSTLWTAIGTAIEPAATSPTITDVDTDNSIYPGQTSITAHCTNMPATASAKIVSGSNSITMSNYDDTSVNAPTFDAPSLSSFLTAGIKFGTVDFEIYN